MIFRNPYWSDKLKISTLQRFILVHSIIYYQLDSNIISDKFYNENANQLEVMQKANEEAFKASQYYYAFKDFTSATGFYLYDALTEKDKKYLMHIANLVLKDHKMGGEKG